MPKSPISIDQYLLFPIEQRWFRGKIYIDKRGKIAPFQMEILKQFINKIIATSSNARDIDLDFHILITGDSENNDFTADIFVFIDGITANDQDVFNNPFSGVHWALNSLFCTITHIHEDLIGYMDPNILKEIMENPEVWEGAPVQ